MTKINGREVVAITPLEGAVALLAAKCRSLISAFASILDENPQEIQEAVSQALALETIPPRLKQDDAEQEESSWPGEPNLPKPHVSVKAKTSLGLSPATLNQIRHYKRTHTVKQVAERFQLTESQATYAVYGAPGGSRYSPKAKVKHHPHQGVRLSDVQLQEMKSRLIAGQPINDIAQHMRLSRDTVYRYKAQFNSEAPIEQQSQAQGNS